MTGHARYTIRRKIADGGTAEIFLATQHGAHGFEKPVVLKRIFPAFSADPHFRNMLIDEAHIAMSLNHSNIVQVLDLGEADSQYVLALELVDGWNLDSVLRRANKANLPIPPALALYTTAEVCRALAYAHAKTGPGGKPLGIVHRDISPHNVLLSEQGEVKLTDFGIATAESLRDQSGGAMIKGKIAYMSPEQAAGAILDARSDLYSVGIMLYVMVCRRFPFDAATDYETLLLVRSGEFVPPQTARPGLNPEIYRVISRAMAKRASDRYQRAEDMLVDVEQVMRVAFRAVGQTELKRWLVELSTRDGVPPLTRQPSASAGAPASGAEGETFELKGIPAAGQTRAPARPPGTGKRPPPPAAALFVGRGGLPPAKDPTEEITLTPLPLTPAPQMAEAVLAAASAEETVPVAAPAVASGATAADAPARHRDLALAARELARKVGTGVGSRIISSVLARLRERGRRGNLFRAAVAGVVLLLVIIAIGALSADDESTTGNSSGASAPTSASPPEPASPAAAAPPAAPANDTAPDPTTPPGAPSEPEGANEPTAAPAETVAAAPVAEPQHANADANLVDTRDGGNRTAQAIREPAAIQGAHPAEKAAAEVAPPPPAATPPAAPAPAAAAAPIAAAAPLAAAPGPRPAARTQNPHDGVKAEPSDDPAEPNQRVPVRLESDPAGAQVTAGTIALGKTPLELKLRGGSVYTVTLTAEGMPPLTKRIYVTGRPNQRVTVDLKGAAAPQAQPAAAKPSEVKKGEAKAKDARTAETTWPKFAR